MKKIKYVLLVFGFLMGTAVAINADNSKEKLVKSLYRDQKQSEEQMLRLWLNNKRGPEMEKILTDYVVREVRLQAMSGKHHTGTLLSSVKQNGHKKFDEPTPLAKAVVLEHFRRRGLDINKCCFVKGKYLIRAECVDITVQPEEPVVALKE